MTTSTERGFSVLELVVALAIVAGLASVVAGSIVSLTPTEVQVGTRLDALLAEARADAVLTGRPQRIDVAPHAVAFDGREVRLDDAWLSVSGNGRTTQAAVLLAYPDGSFSGSPLYLEQGKDSTVVGGMFRGGPGSDHAHE